jgi:uncharacterized protein (TIGR02266 family)
VTPPRILVVDDLAIFRELEARFLAGAGQVFTAESGAEALAIARRERPDVVVADFALPDIEGDALCKELKGDPALASIAVILVTRGLEGESRARAVRAGADDVLVKPIERLTLIEAVSRFLRVPVARSLRVPIATPVRIRRGDREYRGRARTLSRGGVFVETDCDAAPGTEVDLAFRLPETGFDVATTARVVWLRDDEADEGMGLQFLRMDGATSRRIGEYVSERAPRRAGSPHEAC